MTGNIFIDTNILVYAHDLDAGTKRETAKRWVTDLWENRTGVLSTQVLQENTAKLSQLGGRRQ